MSVKQGNQYLDNVDILTQRADAAPESNANLQSGFCDLWGNVTKLEEQIIGIQSLSKSQPEFSEIDMRTEDEQFKSHFPQGIEGNHARLMTTAVCNARNFQTATQSGRCMNQSEGESIFFLIRMIINGQTILGIFDTGSSDLSP